MMWGLLAVLVLVVVGALIYLRSRGSGETDDADEGAEGLRRAVERELARLAAEQGFTRLVVGVDGAAGLALQPDLGRLLVVAPTDPDVDPAPGEAVSLFVRAYPTSAVVGAELRELDAIRMDKDVPELRARAVELHVFVDDADRPVHVLSLLARSARRSSKRYNDARSAASAWEGLLRVARHRAGAPDEPATHEVRAPHRAGAAPRLADVAAGGPPPLPMLEPRAVSRVSDEPTRSDAEVARREAARARAAELLQRARSQG